jgi:hypothetical protein
MTVICESDLAGRFKHRTVQVERKIVTIQVQIMSRVPRVFGWVAYPVT